MYKMVVLDLDGTLLNSASSLSEKNRWVIEKCVKMGIKVVLASGRMHYSMKPIIKKLQLEEDFHIAGNGSTIFSLGGYLEDISILEDEVYRNVVKRLKKEEVEFLVYSKENVYYDYAPKLSGAVLKYGDERPVQMNSIADLKGVPKIVLYLDSEEWEKEKRIREIMKDCAAVLRSHESFVDIVHFDTSKYKAIERLMRFYKIQPKEVIAIGDSENDAELIENVGLGIAMANGSDIVKRVAKYITPKTNDQDGVADTLERLVLKKIS
ncbi:Cof-type HAD-IIB family hydrolase [Irregularibacter muris]|uniref:Cof-type HAD-IIB family hydrolase n=1 Tax=Irregularibacter muris TaxID=1796619 RepID=A0AAE3HFE4_9FIRM|nr:HAD family hydrolase [Irregularibacter muris]MCR1899126.1 Cof-type HAD-IIB family hydrolase [Irregularibacter muris]